MAPGASRSKMYFSVIASIVLMSKFYHTECASTSKSITATLDARWKHTPLLLEASEFLATESNESFWKFVDLVDKAHTFTTPSEHYQHIIEVAGRILRPLGLNFLKLSLSLRYFSPRVELFNKEAHEIATGDCKSFLQLGSKLTCDLNEGVSLIKSSKELPLGWSFDFDHHYPNSESNPVTVVLYGQIGTPSFNTFHQELSLLAKSGKVHYILRHFIKDPSEGSIRLSGFGVELAVKSTEYKAVDDSKVKDESGESVQKVEEEAEDEVDGFLFGRLRKLYPDHKEQLDQFRAHLKESSNEMAPLKVWQLQDLSFQAAQRVLAAEPNRALKVLKDLSQNLPKQARSLVKTKVKEEMRKEILQNQKAFEIEPGQSALSINGLNLDIEDVNPFELLNILRAEAKTMDILSALGITGEGLSALVSMPVQSEHENYILDMRHECVTYVNDLEKDRQYWGWPQELQEILRPTFPGMLRYIAKNIFHTVFFIDPVDLKSIEIVKTAQELLHHSLPARIGVVIVAEDKDDAQSKAAVSIARAFSFIKADKSPLEAFDWLIKLYRSLSGTDAPKAGQVWDAFVASYSRDDADDVFGSDTEYDEDRKSANRLFAKTGRRSLPQVVVNGVPLKEEELDSIEEAIVTELLMQTGGIQRAVYSGALSGYPSVYEYIMRQPNVVGRLNDLVQSMERPFVDLVGSAETSGVSLDDADKFAELEKPQMVSVLCNNLRYFTKKKDELSLKPVTNWVVMDFSRKDGRNLLRAALKHVASSSNTRVGIIHNPSDETPEMLRMGRAVEAVLLSKDHVTPAMAEFLENLLDEKNDLSDIGKASETVTDILKKTEGLKSQSIEKQLQDENAFKGRVLSHQTFAKTVLNLQPGQAAVITNGRVLGPFTEDNVFIEEDFKLLEDFDMDLYARKVRDQVDEMTFPNLSSDDDTSEFRSNVMMKVSSVLISREKKSRKQIEFSDDKHSAIHITSEGAVNFDVVAVVDPLTQDAQKLAPILMVLQNVTGVNLKLFMNCREKLSEMPLKRFYRYVLEPQITFDADSGIMNPGPFAQFSDMPETPLLTMNMDTPLGWMVEAVWSPHDLDNIRLSEVEQGVSAKFDLEYIFVEGHCADSQTGQPPRGLQFTLGTRNKADMFDTIVMANLGYFQLKASPGAWKLRVREGRSAEIYEINSLVGGKYEEESGDFIVTVDSFTGKLIKVKVQRKPGMESADLLSDSNDDSGGGIWDSLSNIVGSDSNKKTEEDQTINVFSVASGHLYERFLRIMMLSVLKHTKSPIKFWFLKNFLSPTLKSLLPHMARQYGFEYELVQYHWPHWLHAQTEKQRVIWGYKILFLDVLFPLHVKRIIFVDADLIVRTDLKELHDMDLGGAPYAYTPFCDSRTEMEGFRFWKQGYWRSHLGGRPYHISALYVVDLKKFRRMAAGDRLRGQYQGLSQDPNSLSNLDQDLPNNMIHQVPIKSLPQEWLWCATWCDEASKVYAKTIDLCNNPMTKEPKLDSAVRIVKEWPDYDNEVRRFQEKIEAEPSVTKPPENLPLPIKEEL